MITHIVYTHGVAKTLQGEFEWNDWHKATALADRLATQYPGLLTAVWSVKAQMYVYTGKDANA